MTRRPLFAFALLLSVVLPVSAIAEAPGSVTGLQAFAQDDGSVAMEWSASEGDVDRYRVYYSQKSILENDGYYDDVETTGGPETMYVLQGLPPSFSTVYISVMAMNALGEESPFFTEEVRVDRAVNETSPPAPAEPTAPSPTQANAEASMSAFSPQAQPSANTLHLLSAQALSATRIALAFSTTPVIDPTQAPAAFSIVDSQGLTLPIEQLTIEGRTALVQTLRQASGMVYQMRLSEPLAGEGGLTLDPIDRTAFFTGHATGLTPQEAAARAQSQQDQTAPAQQPAIPGLGMGQPQAGGLPDVVDFRLSASPQKNQLFMVTGQWELDPAAPDGAFIVVRQSRDGGRTFNAPEFLPGNLNGVQIPNVTPQNFGLVVYVADAEGRSSPGVFKSLFTWNTPQAPAPVAAVTTPTSSAGSVVSPSSTVAPPTPQANHLSQTGAGAMVGIAALGAIAGWKKSRKIKRKA
ncbi:hypothetical protein AUJ46_03445 [Candidatus Peregrinibacteria bacterium CG1_02_54_53]|nr:MAG: hypothetical protein AUJ46_03445 [Candidatus Peregrinibacteria bacterium CG1_02_54_53]